jgi:hypothetical protein
MTKNNLPPLLANLRSGEEVKFAELMQAILNFAAQELVEPNRGLFLLNEENTEEEGAVYRVNPDYPRKMMRGKVRYDYYAMTGTMMRLAKSQGLSFPLVLDRSGEFSDNKVALAFGKIDLAQKRAEDLAALASGIVDEVVDGVVNEDLNGE